MSSPSIRGGDSSADERKVNTGAVEGFERNERQQDATVGAIDAYDSNRSSGKNVEDVSIVSKKTPTALRGSSEESSVSLKNTRRSPRRKKKFPMPPPETLENLATEPLWKSPMSSTPGSCVNKEPIVLRGSSEERSVSFKKTRRSPRRKKKLLMPPPGTVSEDSGFEALMRYSKEREDEVVVQWDGGGMLWGKSFLSLRDGCWLNDEVISGYFILLHQHEFHGKGFFHTQFALQLASTGKYNYDNVKKYHMTKRTGIRKQYSCTTICTFLSIATRAIGYLLNMM
jgi:hypothetical protein